MGQVNIGKELLKGSESKNSSFTDQFGFLKNEIKVEDIRRKTCTKDEILRQMQVRGKVKDDQLSYTKQVPFL